MREIGGLRADEYRGGGVGVARFQGIGHYLQHALILARTGPLRCPLRHGVAAETHDNLRVQRFIRRDAARLEHTVVVADHQRVVEGAQPRERVGKHGDGEGAREGQHALRLLVRGAGAFACQQQHAIGQQLAGKLRRRNAFHAPMHVRGADGKRRFAGRFCPGSRADSSGLGARNAGIEQVGERHIGLERLVEREVQVHRTTETGSGKTMGCARLCSRGYRQGVLRFLVLRGIARPERGDARLAGGLAGEAQRSFVICGQGHPAIGAHVRAVSVRLIAGLRSAQPLQLWRAVGRQHDKRHARRLRLEAGRIVVCDGRTRRAHQRRRTTGRFRHAQRQESSAALVDVHIRAHPLRSAARQLVGGHGQRSGTRPGADHHVLHAPFRKLIEERSQKARSCARIGDGHRASPFPAVVVCGSV